MSLETVVILAAGEGTRMKSSTPKVLHPISGRSLVGHVIHAVSALSPKQVRVVVGAGREEVEAHLSEIAPHVTTVFQEKRGGTGPMDYKQPAQSWFSREIPQCSPALHLLNF
ncbi:MAG: hypothetical protein RLZ23_325 [Actinomycetota bacterium]